MLERALTHRSFAQESSDPDGHNERLEFLGDAVLALAAGERLMRLYPLHSEGRLTKLRAHLVSGENLDRVARSIALGEALRLGRAEERNGGRDKRGLLVDAFEAVVGAVYLDGGLEAAKDLVGRLVLTAAGIERIEADLEAANPKSALQEILQARGLEPPSYRLALEEGPPHDRIFEVELSIGAAFRRRARGATKKAAEQLAAAAALDRRADWLPEEVKNPATEPDPAA